MAAVTAPHDADPAAPDAADPTAPADGRRFAANAASLVMAQAVGKAASFVFVLVVTRGLGTVSYGYFNFALSFVPLFLILGTWGLDVAIVRGVTADRRRLSPLVASGLAIRAGSGVAALVLAFALGPLFVANRTAFATLVLVGVALLLDDITTLLGTVFNVFERTTLLSLVLLLNRVVSTALALVAVAADAGIVTIALTYLAGSFTALVLAAGLLRRLPEARIRLRDADAGTVRQLLRAGAPLGVAGALNMALFRVDAVLLQALQGARAVGMYGIAYRFLDSFLFVAYGIGQVVMPRIAKQGRSPDTTAAAGRSFTLVLGLLLAFYLPLAVGALFTADWLVATLFSDRYADAAAAVKWLTAAGVFYAIAYLARVSSVALGRRRQIAVIAAAVLAANIAGNLVAIPRWGYAGAAAVTFFSEVLEAALLTVVFARTGARPSVDRATAVPVVAVAAMAAVLLAAGLRDAAALAVGAAVYAATLLIAARVLAPDQTRRVLDALRRR